ncbi:MAG: dihydroneopterin aldolase [Arcobacteraceae bacterium]
MKVNIKELTFNTIIGILPFERTKEQQVVINCSFSYNYSNGNFVDYSKVAQDIKTAVQSKKFELIEEAILDIKKELKKNYPIKKLKLYIAKPTILDDCIVEVGE